MKRSRKEVNKLVFDKDVSRAKKVRGSIRFYVRDNIKLDKKKNKLWRVVHTAPEYIYPSK